MPLPPSIVGAQSRAKFYSGRGRPPPPASTTRPVPSAALLARGGGPAGLRPGYAVEFWELANGQDWAAIESVQPGGGPPAFRPGPFSPEEDAVQRFVSRVAASYQGGAGAGPADGSGTGR